METLRIKLELKIDAAPVQMRNLPGKPGRAMHFVISEKWLSVHNLTPSYW